MPILSHFFIVFYLITQLFVARSTRDHWPSNPARLSFIRDFHDLSPMPLSNYQAAEPPPPLSGARSWSWSWRPTKGRRAWPCPSSQAAACQHPHPSAVSLQEEVCRGRRSYRLWTSPRRKRGSSRSRRRGHSELSACKEGCQGEKGEEDHAQGVIEQRRRKVSGIKFMLQQIWICDK